MSPLVDPGAIAARIRSLVGAPNFEGLEAVAQRLRVPEFALRLSLDDKAPQPTLDVLAAIVREYGVDPSWLIHGVYDSSTHNAVLDGERDVTPITLLTLATSPHRVTPVDAYELRVDLPLTTDIGVSDGGAP